MAKTGIKERGVEAETILPVTKLPFKLVEIGVEVGELKLKLEVEFVLELGELKPGKLELELSETELKLELGAIVLLFKPPPLPDMAPTPAPVTALGTFGCG